MITFQSEQQNDNIFHNAQITQMGGYVENR